MCVFMKKKIVIKKQPCSCLCFGAEGGTRSRGKPTPQTGNRRRVPAPCSWGFASGTCLHKAESPTEVIKKQRMLFCGAEGGTRSRGKPTPQTGNRRRVPAPCSWGFASGTCLHKAESPTEVIKKQRMLFCGAEGGTRTPMRLPSADFESAPSTIPALRLIQVLSLTNEFRIA